MNTHILVAGGVILSVGVLRAAGAGQPLSRPILGAGVFVLILSLFDAFGSAQLNRVIGAIALLAMITALTIELPPLLAVVQTHTTRTFQEKTG